jgi:hypothetical protein
MKHRTRKPVRGSTGGGGHRGNGRPPKLPPNRPRIPRLTIPIPEAAGYLGVTERTLRRHLKRTNASCLVRGIGHPKLDRKGFFTWCKAQGFEGAGG